jgi:hypothetical protein
MSEPDVDLRTRSRFYGGDRVGGAMVAHRFRGLLVPPIGATRLSRTPAYHARASAHLANRTTASLTARRLLRSLSRSQPRRSKSRIAERTRRFAR